MKNSDPLTEIHSSLREIETKGPRPVYLISGSEDYFVYKAREAIRSAIEEKVVGAGIEYLDGDNLDVNDLVCRLNSPSLFDPFRIIVVRNYPFFRSKPAPNDEKKFLNWLNNTTGKKGRLSTVLICTADKLDKRLSLVKTVEKSGKILVFNAAQTYERGVFQKDPYFNVAKAFLAENKKSINPKAWMILRQRAANNLWAVMNALEILICFCPDKQEITPAMVDTMIAVGEDLPVFCITEALGERNAQDLRLHLESLLSTGTPAVMINKLLTSRIRSLIIMKEMMESVSQAPIKSDLKYWDFQREILPSLKDRMQTNPILTDLIGSTHPYAMYQHCLQAQKFSRSNLSRALIELSGVDFSLKSSSKSPLVMFEMALLPLCYSN